MTDPTGSDVRVLVHYPFPGELTGGPRSVLLLLDALQRHGLRSILLTEEEGPLARAAAPLVEEVWIESAARAGGSGLRVSPLALARAVPAALAFLFRLWRRLRGRGVDVVWTRGAKGVLLVAPVAKLLSAKVVWDVDLEFPSVGPYRLLNRLCLATSDLVVAQSARYQEGLFGHFSDASRKHVAALLPPVPGARAEEIRTRLEAEDMDVPPMPDGSPEPTVLVVGTITVRKNQLAAVRALALLTERVPDVRLDLVGPGRDAVYVERLSHEIEELDLTDRVRLHGWREDALDFMLRADVLLVPSVAEGVPHVIREAMLAGLPVVASAVGGVPELVSDGVTGWLVDPASPSDMAAALERCLTDPDKRTEVVTAAREFAERELDSDLWGTEYIGRIVDLVSPAGRGSYAT